MLEAFTRRIGSSLIFGSAYHKSTAYVARMKVLEQDVRALLQAARQERKAVLDRGKVDTVFRVGNQVLLWAKELLDAAEIGKLRPRWGGPVSESSSGSGRSEQVYNGTP